LLWGPAASWRNEDGVTGGESTCPHERWKENENVVKCFVVEGEQKRESGGKCYLGRKEKKPVWVRGY